MKEIFLLFVRIYKQLDAMIQNGILLSFTRLATRLCFLDVRLSVLCLPLSRRPESCTHVLSKTFPNQSRRTGRTAPVRLLTKLQYQTWAYYLWVSICILLSTLCTLCFKATAFSRSSTALSGFLIPTTSSLLFPLSPSASKYVCVCVESLLEFAGQGGSLKDVDFSQH